MIKSPSKKHIVLVKNRVIILMAQNVAQKKCRSARYESITVLLHKLKEELAIELSGKKYNSAQINLGIK